MPLYEYECGACGRRFELIRKFSDSAVEVCTLCGKGPVNRLVSSPAIQFKGSGFYITDYAKKGEGGKGEGVKEGGKGEGGKTDSTSESTKSDSATASTGTKTETKSDSAAKSDSSAASAPAKTSGPAKD
jgi:putative FmdB family regulatory protein